MKIINRPEENSMEQDQAFVEYVVKAMVDRPDDVSSDRTVDEMGVLITLKVNPEDLGQVIGRQGQTAKSLRTLLRVVGAKNHARVNLKIYEPEGYRKHAPRTDAPMEANAPAAPAEENMAASGMGDDLKI
jgi:predicted RNA-binding protein YlqC (UPF0109 family)